MFDLATVAELIRQPLGVVNAVLNLWALFLILKIDRRVYRLEIIGSRQAPPQPDSGVSP